MNKKIFDILPPGIDHNKPEKISIKKKTKNFKIGWKSGTLATIVLLILGGALYQIFGTKFVLNLEPNTRIVNLETEFRVWDQTKEINFDENILPGQILTDEHSATQTFMVSGEKTEEQKATGIIRVYNAENPPREIHLRATTRFLSSNGVYFRTPEGISLPPAKIESGRLVPSWVDVSVEAMDPGESSNIGQTKFSVPGLLGTDLYDKIYGESFEDMTGGEIIAYSEVTSSDLRQAEESLKFDLVNNLISTLGSEEEKLVILPEAIETQDLISEASSEVGDLEESFEYHLGIEGQALVFSEDDLRQLLDQVVIEKVGQEYLIVPDSLYFDYRVLSFDSDDHLLRVNLKFSAEVYRDLALDQWPDKLSALTKTEMKNLLLSDDRLSAFQFRLTPFWLRKLPRPEKIITEIKFK